MEPKITTFIFDCFGVICDPVLNGWYRENRLKHGFVDENLKNVFEKFDMGEFSEEDVLQYFLNYKEVNSTREELRKEIDSFMKLDDSMVDILKKLKQNGFKVMLLSNGHSDFYKRKIYPTYPGFQDLFDQIIISSDVKMIKPNSEMYLYALEKINSKPEESVFVDDSNTNVKGAEAVGIKGFLFTDSSSFSSYLNSLGINL